MTPAVSTIKATPTKAPVTQDSSALSMSLGEDNFHTKKRIMVEVNGPTEFNIKFEGLWTGRLLQAVIKLIEHQYKRSKFLTLRESLIKQHRIEPKKFKIEEKGKIV